MKFSIAHSPGEMKSAKSILLLHKLFILVNLVPGAYFALIFHMLKSLSFRWSFQ